MVQYHPCHLWLQIPMRPCGNLGLAEICLCCIFHLHLQALVVHGLLCDSGQDRRCLLALQCLPLAIHTLLFESLLASVVEVSMGASPYGPPQSVMLPCLPQRDCLENVASAWTGRGVCSMQQVSMGSMALGAGFGVPAQACFVQHHIGVCVCV